MTAKVPTIDTGTAIAGMTVGHTLRRNRKITITTSPIVSISVNCTSATEARMVVVRSEITEILMADGMDAWSCGSAAFTACTVSITLAPGRRSIARMMPRCRLTQPFSVMSCGPMAACADIGYPDRSAVAPGDDLVVPVLRLQDLIVGLQGEGTRLAVQGALGLVDAHIGECGAHVLQIETIGRELRRIELDANRRVLLAADTDQPDTRHLRELLRQDALGVVVHGSNRQRIGGEAEYQDRRVGRIGLVVGRLGEHVLRQLTRRGVDRRLDQRRRRADVVVQRELQRNIRVAE